MPMPQVRRIVIAALALVALVVALVAGARLRSTAADALTVRQAPLVQSVVVTGRVASESRVFLGSTITGRVRTVAVREGARVRAGELVVQIDDAEQASALRQAEAALAGAQARLASQRGLAAPLAQQQLEQARANADAAASERTRNESLFQQGFIGQARLDEARRAASVAASQLRAAEAQAQANLQGPELQQATTRVQEAQAALELARVKLAQTRIVAPADGTVLARAAEPGQIVQPGSKLMEMSLSGPTQLVAQVDEKFLGQLAPGQVASVVADAFPGQPFAARVASIAPGIDAQRGSVEVKFAVDPVPAFLKNDMTLSIEVVTARRERALALPTEALRAGDQVLLLEDGRAASRKVRTGIRTLQAVEVIEGLAEGDVVLLDAGLSPGQRVRVRPPRPAGAAAVGEGLGQAMQGFGR